MPKMKLTAQGIKGLPTPATGRTDYQDVTVPGLILRVSASGKKSFSVSYWRRGKRPRVTLGDTTLIELAEARKQARDLLRDVKLGIDPVAEKRERERAILFEELAREYLRRWAKPRKTAKGAREDELKIERVLIPRWGSWKARDVRKRDVVSLLDEYAEAGKPYAANRLQALISKMFNFGIKRDAVEVNPAAGIDREPEKPRERVLSDDELRSLLPLFREEGLSGLGFKLLLLTGQRPAEVFGLRWSEIEGDVWSLPAERSKNGRPNLIPLSPESRRVLQDLRAFDNHSGFVFPSRNHGQHLKNYLLAGHRIRAKAGLAEDWRIYDLKSTCLTGLERLGVAWPVVAAVANHAPTSITRRHYSFYSFDDEKRDALDRWSRHVDGLDPATTARVIRLRT